VPVTVPATSPTPGVLSGLAVLVALLVLALSVRPVANMLSPGQMMNTSFDPLHLVNTYGAFGSVTRNRHQLVVEGTNVERPTEEDWQPYECKGQPGRTGERPPQWAPYHLRLDWQLWFAAMVPRPGPRQRWFLAFLRSILEGDEAVLGLLRSNPFPEDPPDKVRVLRYRYRFTTPEERAQTGEWWARERIGTYVGPVTLGDLRDQQRGRRVRTP
ncbi:MAG: lipase maturation factor family protein, partial [Halobacteriales archaeon]|nr:lipase maturation factor family protein [Halobacteriales archaeon]